MKIKLQVNIFVTFWDGLLNLFAITLYSIIVKYYFQFHIIFLTVHLMNVIFKICILGRIWLVSPVIRKTSTSNNL